MHTQGKYYNYIKCSMNKLHTILFIMYLVSEIADVTSELSIRWELGDMFHQVLDHFQMTLRNISTCGITTV